MTATERRLRDIANDYQQRMIANCDSVEQIFLMEIVRSLDEAAYAFMLAPNRQQLRRDDRVRNYMLRGAALALGPFLRKVYDMPGPIPLVPTNPKLASLADDYLINCGTLTEVIRISALERYGLCQSKLIGRDRILLEVSGDSAERHDVESLRYLTALVQEGRSELESALLSLTPRVHKQLDRYVRIDREEFIAYDNDEDLVSYYRQLAELRATDFFESEALPGHSVIGGRPFNSWCDRTVAAAGRVLQHTAFACRLKALHPRLELRNLMTIYARKEDLVAVLEEFGDTHEQARHFVEATTLDDASADDYLMDFEIPVPLYVAFSRDFVLLPCFGALLNPIAGIVRALRQRHRSDWDRSVEGREEIFRSDLADIFQPPRFLVSTKGVVLRRSDGTKLTDIDGIVEDRETGAWGVFQLKWHDIFGRSLRERHSRRLNLLKANEWVERVSRWLKERSASETASALGLEDVPKRAPFLFVVSRYAAQFSGNDPYDARAAWLTWADVLRSVPADCAGDVLQALATKFKAGVGSVPASKTPAKQQFKLPGLTVDVSWS